MPVMPSCRCILCGNAQSIYRSFTIMQDMGVATSACYLPSSGRSRAMNQKRKAQVEWLAQKSMVVSHLMLPPGPQLTVWSASQCSRNRARSQ